jgi:hypothetical protein
MTPPDGETWCSHCRALLEDSSENYVEGEDGFDALRMDLMNSRVIGGKVICQPCYWQVYGTVRAMEEVTT